MAKQFQFKGLEKPNTKFGGALLKSNPKSKRPLSTKLPIHLVLRARKSVLRTTKHFGKTHKTVYETAKKYGVSIYEFANVGNHLHLLIRLPKMHLWAAFIRELTGRIAQQQDEKGFWLHRPFTRVVGGWRKAFQIAKEYVNLNFLEAEGFIDRRQTKTLKDYRAIFDG